MGKCVSCPGKCGAPQYKGDGNCDDVNNNCGCDFDGGDCCNGSVKGGSVKTTYCKECQCKDPKHPDEQKCKEKCALPHYIGDGNCDDENNNCGCKFDGGDCCRSSVKGGFVKTTYCKECKCKDPKYPKDQNVRESARIRTTSAMVTATMRTTIAAASSMEATAVRAQSKVGVSKQPTAKNASARILNTRKTKNVRRSARIRTTSAMVTATMRTTIVAAISIKATAVVMS